MSEPLFRAALFDFDGVICQTETFKMRRMTAYLQELGLTVEKKKLYRLAGGTSLDREAMLDEIFGEKERYWQVKEQVLQFRSFPKAPFPYRKIRTPGLPETLEELRRRGVRMAVASNSPKERLLEALAECEIAGYFDVVESGMDSGRRKPDPYIYVRAMEQMHLRPEECIVVEDSAMGIRAGRASGAKVIALRDEDGGIDQSEADAVIGQIGELLDFFKF